MEAKMISAKVLSRKEKLTNEMKWKEALLSRYDITPDMGSIDEAITAIGAATTELNLHLQELRANNEEIESIKVDVQLDCLSKVDAATGKPLATNDTARRALLESELAKSAAYQAAMQKGRELQERIDHYKGEIEYQGRRYVAARLAVEHKTACVRVLGF